MQAAQQGLRYYGAHHNSVSGRRKENIQIAKKKCSKLIKCSIRVIKDVCGSPTNMNPVISMGDVISCPCKSDKRYDTGITTHAKFPESWMYAKQHFSLYTRQLIIGLLGRYERYTTKHEKSG